MYFVPVLLRLIIQILVVDMFALVQFLDDGIYHVTKASSIRHTNSDLVYASYKSSRYAAKLLCCSDKLKMLIDLKESLDNGGPWVYLTRIAASISSDGDGLPTESYPLEDLSSPGCTFSESDDDSMNDKLYNPEEDSDDRSDDQYLHTDLDQPFTGEINNNITVRSRNTLEVTFGENQESNEDCEKIENTSHEICINQVPKSDEKKCKKYFCVYCKKLVCKFARHLEVKHKNVQEVIELSLLPKDIDGQLESSTDFVSVEKEVAIEYSSDANSMNYEQAYIDMLDEQTTIEDETKKNVTIRKKNKRSVSPVGYVKRSSWSEEEKSHVLQAFRQSIESQVLPTTESLANFISSSLILKDRNPIQLKSWLSNQIQKQRKAEPNCRRRKGPVMYWTTPEKTILQKIFDRHIKSKTLPSLAACKEVISKYPELRQRTSETVKAWVNNQSKKICKQSK